MKIFLFIQGSGGRIRRRGSTCSPRRRRGAEEPGWQEGCAAVNVGTNCLSRSANTSCCCSGMRYYARFISPTHCECVLLAPGSWHPLSVFLAQQGATQRRQREQHHRTIGPRQQRTNLIFVDFSVFLRISSPALLPPP